MHAVERHEPFDEELDLLDLAPEAARMSAVEQLRVGAEGRGRPRGRIRRRPLETRRGARNHQPHGVALLSVLEVIEGERRDVVFETVAAEQPLGAGNPVVQPDALQVAVEFQIVGTLHQEGRVDRHVEIVARDVLQFGGELEPQVFVEGALVRVVQHLLGAVGASAPIAHR